MSDKLGNYKERAAKVFELGVAELEQNRLHHITYNQATQYLHQGVIGQDDYELITDVWTVSGNKVSVMPYELSKAVRTLERRYGIWKELPEGPSSVPCRELAIRIADGEFSEITFVFKVANAGYSDMNFMMDGEMLDYYGNEQLARMLGSADEEGRYIDVEYYSSSLYLMFGQFPPAPTRRQVFTEVCPNCWQQSMVTYTYINYDDDNTFSMTLQCHNCGTKVRINVEGDASYDEEDDDYDE